MIRKIFIRFIFSFFFITTITGQDDIKVNVKLNKSEVYVNEVFQINVEIVGTQDNASVENIENLDSSIIIKPSGVMSNLSFINGDFIPSMVFSYLIKITKSGNYEIGPFILKNYNKSIKSEKIKINVIENNDKQNASYNKLEDQDKAAQFYYMEVKSIKNEIYVNEALEVEVNLLFENVSYRQRAYQPLKFPASSWVEKINIENENDEKIRRNNKIYNLKKIEKNLVYISKPGKYTIVPSQLEFFGVTSSANYAQREILRLKSNTLELSVKPFPDKAPNGFKDAVGNFKLDYNLTPLKLKERELATLRIQLSGSGNFQNINDILYECDNSIEVYSNNSSITKQAGRNNERIKNWEILLVPQKQGKFKLKIKDFSYFDPNQNKFIVIKGKEFSLNILKNEDEDFTNNKKASAAEDQLKIQAASKENFNNIQHIKLLIGNKKNIFFEKFWFNYLIIFYLVVLFLIVIFIMFKSFFVHDLILNYLKRNDEKAYLKFIKKIKIFRNEFDEKTFSKEIDKISEIIEKYFMQKFNIDTIELTSKSIESHLGIYLNQFIINDLKNIISKLDLIRFGGEKISKEEFFNIIKFVIKIIKDIENKKDLTGHKL